MTMTSDLQHFYDYLDGYDPIDIAAGIGALQLMPENAECQLRLNRASSVAHCLRPARNRQEIPYSRWHEIMNHSPIADQLTKSYEDPAEQVFTSQVPFEGREHTVFQGLLQDSANSVTLLLKASCNQSSNLSPDLKKDLTSTSLALLTISHRIASQARLLANTKPVAQVTINRTLEVPSAHRLRKLKAAVTFTDRRLNNTLKRVPDSAITELISHPRSNRLDLSSPADVAYFRHHPIVCIENKYIVTNPSAILTTIIQNIIAKSIRASCENVLTCAFRDQATDHVRAHLTRMNWKLHFQSPDEELPSHCFNESLWTVDTNKLAHVVVLVDDVSRFRRTDALPGSTNAAFEASRIEARIVDVNRSLRTQSADNVDILHIVVTQDIGQPMFIGLDPPTIDANTGKKAQVILASQAELGVIAKLCNSDPLAFWKFAVTYNDIRQHLTFITWSLLDTFAFYHENNSSFQPDHEVNINRVSAISAGPEFGNRLRIDDCSDHTYRELSVSAAGQPRVLERFPSTGEEDFFASHPVLEPATGLLTEIYSLKTWITLHDPHDRPASGDREALFQICRAVAFWLRECSPSLKALFRTLCRACSDIHIRLSIDDPNPHVTGDRSLFNGKAWISTKSPAAGIIDVRLHSHYPVAIGGPHNCGERRILERIITCLAKSVDRIDSTTVQSIAHTLNKHAPIGPKKMMLSFDERQNPRLLRGVLPPARTLNQHDLNNIRDELAMHTELRIDRTMVHTTGGERTQLLNHLVEHYFAHMKTTIAPLDPISLLFTTLAHHESLVKRLAHEALTVPTRIACFGRDSQHIHNIHQGIDELVEADAALRFVIEYISAEPPSGTSPASLAIVDKLIALSHQIIYTGFLSDALHYTSAPISIHRLPSNRISLSYDSQYYTGMQDFRSLRSQHDTDAYRRYFANHWESSHPEVHSNDAEILDGALHDEFGFTMTDIYSIVDSMTILSTEIPAEPKSLERSRVVDYLVTNLQMPDDHISRIIDQFTLSERESFKSGDMTEVYPWRFNRDKSYIRRPFIFNRTSQKELLVWGARHMNRSADDFLRNIASGRMRAAKQSMKAFMSRTRAQESKRFNEGVATVFGASADVETRINIDRFGDVEISRSRSETLGDIDVLVVNKRLKRILAIESKDFAQARTPFEVHNEIKKLFEGSDSALRRHMERLSWLKQHIENVLSEFRMSSEVDTVAGGK